MREIFDSSEAQESMAGRTIADRYQLIESLGTGTAGNVYKATDRSNERQLAIKLLHRQYQVDPALVQQFWREAQAASAIAHDNVVEVVDFGQDGDGTLYLVMEYIDGQNLKALTRKGAIDSERAISIMLQVLSALSAAHKKGIVHRDLRPENVMVADAQDGATSVDVVKLLDFAIARVKAPTAGGSPRTMQMAAATPEFMSPEQCRGQPVDQRSDIYACGCLLHLLLTGSVPFKGKSAYETVSMHIKAPVTPPSKVNDDVSAKFDPIVLKALSKRPQNRYQNATGMRADLAGLATRLSSYALDAVQVTPTPSAPGAPTEPNRARSRAVPRATARTSPWRLVFGLLLAIAIAGAAVAVQRGWLGPPFAAPDTAPAP